MHADIRTWIRLVEGFRTPKVLYHGSKPELLDKIKQEGLTAATDTSWREFGQGVYLALSAETARNYGELVFIVDVSKLDQSNLVPDDDELAVHFQGEAGEDDDGPTGIHEATWLDSLRICDQCQYLGDIPPSALQIAPKPKPDPRTVWSVDFEFANGERERRDGFNSFTKKEALRQIDGYWGDDKRGKPRILSIKPAPKA